MLVRSLFFMLVCFNVSYAKNLIITFCYNCPEFIEMQAKTFKRFVLDEYDYVVFSDAPHEQGHALIAQKCAELGVTCVRIPQSIHEHPYYLPLNMPEIYGNHQVPSNVRHVHCVQYSLNTIGFDCPDTVLLIDSDMFLVRPLHIGEYMKDLDVASFFKGSDNGAGKTIMYMCPALTFLNMKTLPNSRSMNFNCGWVNECSGDSGGFTHYYLKEHPELRMKSVDSLYSGQMYCSDRFFPNENRHNVSVSEQQKIEYWKQRGFNEKEITFLLKNPDTIQYFMEGNDCWFFHYRGGSNYENLPQEYHVRKKVLINEYLDAIMSK